jgi:hypothetical protein
MQDCLNTMGPDISVSSLGHLCDLFLGAGYCAQQHCKRLAQRLAHSEDVTVIIDGTGLRFNRASQRHEEKYSKKAVPPPWRKMGLGALRGNCMEVNDLRVEVDESAHLAWIGGSSARQRMSGCRSLRDKRKRPHESRAAVS